MARPVAYDISNYGIRLFSPTPTGIGRIDLAYGRYLLERAPALTGVMSGPRGPRLHSASAVRRHVEAVERRWRERASNPDEELTRICQWLQAPAGERVARFDSEAAARRRLRFLPSSLRVWTRHQPGVRIPEGAVYLNVAFSRLHRPRSFEWLDKRLDVKAVFFVHDLLPIEHPEFFSVAHAERFQVVFQTLLRRARGVIVSNAIVKERFESLAGEAGRHIRVQVAEFPPDVAAAEAHPLDAVLDGTPYFVVCSTIEPRKNHLLLLQVWRELAKSGGPAPKLLVIGARGWENEQVIDFLDRCRQIAHCVLEISNLSSETMYRLMSRARGVLMPSFAEGYGLPLVEGLALGAPVVASDIPVFRLVTQSRGRYLSPIDGMGWKAEIEKLAFDPAYFESRKARSLTFTPRSWRDHFASVETFLESL